MDNVDKSLICPHYPQKPFLITYIDGLIVPIFLATNLGLTIFFLFCKKNHDWWYTCGVLLLIFNVFTWWLPLSPLLYPERVIPLALIPMPFVLIKWLTNINKPLFRYVSCTFLIISTLATW